MWTRMRLWLVSLLRRRRFDTDLSDELGFHLRARAEHWQSHGLSTAEAMRRAQLEFGSLARVRAEVGDVRRGAWVERLVLDVRYGVRALRRHSGFSALAVLSLAIGIGANTAIFGVVQAVLLHDSGVAHPETLVNLYETEAGRGFNPMSYPNIEDLRRGTTGVFSGIAASTFAGAPIAQGADVATTVMGEAVTGGAFALLGVEPQLGRAILPEDDVARGGHPVVMLSHGYWQRAFGGDPAIVGRTIRMGRRTYTVIGVAPAAYHGGVPALTPAFYVPMAMLDDLTEVAMLDQRDFHSFFVKARLAPGVSRAQAEHAASLVAASLSAARPEGWVPGEHFVFVPTADVRIYPGLDPILRAAGGLLIAIVGLVLLLACTNLASVLLARSLDRSQESAVRLALGATRAALARQLLVESGLLGLAGAAAGLGVAIVLINALVLADLQLPYGVRLDLHLGLDWHAVLDWRVLVFTAGAGVLAAAGLGFIPAIQGTRADPGSALGAAGRGTDAPGPRRWRNALVVAQVAMSLLLLVGAGLFLRSWQKTLAVDPGFGRSPTAIVSLVFPVTQAAPDGSVPVIPRLLAQYRSVPGVEAVGVIWPLPLELSASSTDFTIDGRVPPSGREAFRADNAFVDGGFFDAAGMSLVQGRTFNDADGRTTQPVAMVSQALARRYWPDGSAVGRMLRRPDPAEADLLIVGVVSDINVRALGEAPRDVVYVLHSQASVPMLHFVARTTIDPAAMTQTLITAGRAVDPDLRVMQSTTMDRHLALSRLPSQLGAFMLTAFAAIAMALASIGIYGMVRHLVAMRTREVGIRMALGADASGVTRMLAMHGVRLVLLGGAIGLAASVLAARFLATLLFGVGSFDAAALGGAPAVLGVIAFVAAWLPARRASRVDPLTALRAE